MTRTGPQKIPGASQTYFYGSGQYSGSAMEINCGVVHTTEGRSLPGYGGGALAPTVTGVPDMAARRIRWYQHFDVDESARALANRAGGVETNTANVFQVELVGTCDDSKKVTWSGKRAGVDYLHWPTAPDWALAEVAWLVRWLHTEHGVPLSCVRDWLAYGPDVRRPGVVPASYGASKTRMTPNEWTAFRGWCGHQHVPENDHGDPGSMDFARVIALAKGATTEEDDMPTAKEIAAELVKVLPSAVWAHKLTSQTAAPGTDPTRQAGVFLAHTDVKQARLLEILTELRTAEAAQTAAITALAKLVGTGVDTAAVVTAVQDAITDAVIKVSVDVTSSASG